MSIELELVGSLPTGLNVEPVRHVFDLFVATIADTPNGVINATFLNEAEARELNERSSGNDYATDVLSFSYIEDGAPIEDVLGELAICTEIAARQAEAAGTNLTDEVALLVLHGTMHVFGLDHQTTHEQSQMQETQRALLEQAGITYRDFIWQT